MRSLILALVLATGFSALPAHAARPDFDDISEDARKKIGDLKPTFYWVALEEDDGDPRTHALKDMAGNRLAMVSEKFYGSIRLEGTGRLLDGRVINYAGRVNKPGGGQEVRYLVCPPSAPYGYGVDERPLIPFRSVAVDPSVVPMGSRVFIPQAVGAVLPNGDVHDGMFQAVDIGDAIKSKRIDVFTGYGDQSRVFTRVGFVNMKPFPVYLVK